MRKMRPMTMMMRKRIEMRKMMIRKRMMMKKKMMSWNCWKRKMKSY